MRAGGWLPNPPDTRDRGFVAGFGARAGLRAGSMRYATPVRNQGQVGDCVAVSTCDALAIREAMVGVVGDDPSAFALYWLARAVDGFQNRDDGCYIRSAMSVLRNSGVPRESDHPSTPASRVFTPPGPLTRMHGHQRRGGQYVRLYTVEDMIASLANGLPFVAGIQADDAFERLSQVNPVWQPGGATVGGHCMVFVDYDADKGQLVGKNSWGTGWGDAGYWYLPISVARSHLFDASAIDGWEAIRVAS